MAEEKDKAEADSREKDTKYLSLSRALQVNYFKLFFFLLDKSVMYNNVSD